MNKRGKTKTSSGAILIGVALVVILGFMVYAMFFAGPKVQFNEKGEEIVQCDPTVSPSLTIKAYDFDNVGTALTESTNLYRLKGTKSWTAFTQGTAITALSVGDEIEYILGISTTDFTDNAYGRYVKSYTVPCKETIIVEEAVYNDEVETSLTATFYNADGDAGAETFSAGETQTVSVQLKTGTDEYFGNPTYEGMPNVIVLGLNSTEWDQPEQLYLSDGTELNSVSVPGRLSAVAGIQFYAYQLPLIGDKKVEVFMDLNADDTNAPATDMTGYIYAGNYFINAETGQPEFGVETEEDAAVGTDAADTVTLDFTA